MIRLKNETQIIYDANVIIYSLFPEKYKIPFLTTSAKKLNNFLLNQESTIVVPHFIISEIERKGYYNVIRDYFKDLRPSSRFQLMIKLRHNFENLKNMKIFHKNIISLAKNYWILLIMHSLILIIWIILINISCESIRMF